MIAWVCLPLLILICLSPLAGFLADLNWEVFRQVLDGAKFNKVIWVTVTSAFGGAVFSLIIGAFFARQFSRYHWRGKRLQRLGLLLPYLVPNFVLAIAYVTAWNPASGILLRVLPLPFELYGIGGMIWLFGVVHSPVAFLLIEDKLSRIDSSLIEAARTSGMRPRRIFFKIELPLLKPTLWSAVSLCFALNISAFAIPAWIGAPAKTYPLSYKVYQSIQMGGMDGMPEAAAYGVILLVLALLPALFNRFASHSDKRFTLVTGKSARPLTETLTTKQFSLFQAFYFVSQFIFWIAPLATLSLTTVLPPGCLQDRGLSCLQSISLSKYHYVLFELSETNSAIRGSLGYGTVAAALIVALSVVFAAVFFNRVRESNIAEWVINIPLATPGALIALGLIVTASGRFGLNLYNTPWIAVAAYVIKHLSLGYSPLRTGLGQISMALVEAARLSGASTLQVWRRILIPLLAPEMLGGFFLVLIPILGELTMSVFLASPSFKSIGTVLFDLQDYADQAAAAALAILLVIMILMLNEMARRLSRGKLGY